MPKQLYIWGASYWFGRMYKYCQKSISKVPDKKIKKSISIKKYINERNKKTKKGN